MSSPKVILSPNGVAVVLDKITTISEVYMTWGGSNIGYNGLNFRITDITKEYTDFSYLYAKYSEDKDTLLKKVQNIRAEILKLINDGVEVKEINGGINLKKEEPKEKIDALPPAKPVKK